MKGFHLFFVVLGFVLWSSGVRAEVKIGYVDVDQALLETKAGKEVDKTLKKSVEKKQKELQNKENDIKKMTKDLEKKKTILSVDAFGEKRRELQEEMLRFQEFASKSQLELQKQRNKLLKPLAEKMEEVIAEIAKEEGYTAIFRKSPQVLLWASQEVDLTKQIIKRFEKKKKKKSKRSKR